MEYEAAPALGTASPSLWRRAFPWLRVFTQLLIAAALLTLLLWRVDVASVKEELEGANLWWLPLAFAANLGSDWFRAIRWQQFFAPLRHLDTKFLYGVAVLGVACNIALPLRAGEIVRVQFLRSRTGLAVSSIVATILSEKLADIIAYSTFLMLGIVLYREAHFMWPIAVVYAIVLIVGIWLTRRVATWAASTEAPLAQPEGKLRSWVWRQLHGLGLGLQSFQQRRALFKVVWTSQFAWLFEATMYYACGRALGLDLDPAVYLLVVVAATIAVSIPITIAGLGVFELAITGLLVAFGVSDDQAAAYAIFAHLVLALPYLVAGPIAAVALRINITDILFLRAGGEMEKTPAAPVP
jgi:hypothetical protein